MELLNDFKAIWLDLEAAIRQSLGTKKSELLDEELVDSFEENRARASRLYPRVRDLFPYTTAIRSQAGITEQLGVFTFVLDTLPNLYSFREVLDGDGYRTRFQELRPSARSALQQAPGSLEHRLDEFRLDEEYLHPLGELAEKADAKEFLRHLARAEEHLQDGDDEDAIHSSRRAIDRLATGLANKVARDARKRNLRDALNTLADHDLLDPATVRLLSTPKSGVWVWLSELGSHDEDSGADDSPPTGPDEGRFAIELAAAVCFHLLQRDMAALEAESQTG